MMSRIGTPSRTRRVGAVTFIYFALVMLPVLTFSASLAVDFTTIIVAQRQVHNTAQAAALAGAQQFIVNSPYLDSSKAKAEAARTYCLGAWRGTMLLSQAPPKSVPRVPPTSCPPPSKKGAEASVAVTTSCTVGTGCPAGAANKISVTATFHIPNLVFTKLAIMLLGIPTTATDTGFKIGESAAVCISSVADGSTNGFCYKAGRAKK